VYGRVYRDCCCPLWPNGPGIEGEDTFPPVLAILVSFVNLTLFATMLGSIQSRNPGKQ